MWLVLSGSFSWLNAITIVLAFSAMDDSILSEVIPLSPGAPLMLEPLWHQVAVLVVAGMVVGLSYWPVRNLVSRRQLMNFSFNPLHLVNTYGAFGSITRTRFEVIIEATEDDDPGPGSEWREYAFKGKPGDPARRPRQVAPYHLRLDWLMWFIPLSPSYAQGWFGELCVKLLQADPATLRLLAHAPFGTRRPIAVRALLYRYRFTTRAERKQSGHWWHREPVGTYLPPVTIDDVG
jgi:hypothetical protein